MICDHYTKTKKIANKKTPTSTNKSTYAISLSWLGKDQIEGKRLHADSECWMLMKAYLRIACDIVLILKSADQEDWPFLAGHFTDHVIPFATSVSATFLTFIF